MGQGWQFYACRKRPEVVRRDPFTDAQKILVDPEALEMIWFSLKTNPPGTKMRWMKLVEVANRIIEPTEEEPDPVRLDITRETMKEILRKSKVNIMRFDSDCKATSYLPRFSHRDQVDGLPCA